MLESTARELFLTVKYHPMPFQNRERGISGSGGPASPRFPSAPAAFSFLRVPCLFLPPVPCVALLCFGVTFLKWRTSIRRDGNLEMPQNWFYHEAKHDGLEGHHNVVVSLWQRYVDILKTMARLLGSAIVILLCTYDDYNKQNISMVHKWNKIWTSYDYVGNKWSK